MAIDRSGRPRLWAFASGLAGSHHHERHGRAAPAVALTLHRDERPDIVQDKPNSSLSERPVKARLHSS
jgi:hypothetical protein